MNHPADDIAIIGAGPLGLATALALARRGHTPQIFDARSAAASQTDSRILALSQGSRDLLELLGAWPAAQATPIRRILVSQQGHFGQTHLDVTEQRVAALGYVVPARHLTAALQASARAWGLRVAYDTRAKLQHADSTQASLQITHADASLHEVRTSLIAHCEGHIPDAEVALSRDYDQHALLCRATPATPHENLAHERFTPQGPLALLPHGSDYAVVWTVSAARADALMSAPDTEWLAQIQAAIGPHIQLTNISERARHPLGLRMRSQTTGPRCVWLGNAAQTLHPVAGQGFNLALRDAWELADTLTGAADPGAPDLLARYARRRQPDRQGAARFTDLLVRSFSNDQPLLAAARGAGLLALDALPPLRGFVARRMIYGARNF
ncbi:FAD-dependent oxidoreductase [Uliginosibacterium sp. 31-16]|uniref:FAD-dependent oxidoreductase n=1 Tax=Uliginosibacterium sp. 31-16 TaxID=3068315 RepID=UPI00274004E6|nr:FAD-dependent oxidoreductase [Uliginosibacterium sp. 31-16]MDP5238216.1 FAD-dependent oxidoreductase [Uliginosibacterium sp. 31-16]